MGQRQRVTVRPRTRAGELYRAEAAEENFYCSYGVNPDWARRLQDGGLAVSGVGAAGEMRIVELPQHPFFLATLFLPQARSAAAAPHPLLVGFAAAVAASPRGRADA